MGKLHRIRKDFIKMMADPSFHEGWHVLDGRLGLYIGKNYNGSTYFVLDSKYKKFMEKLVKEYKGGSSSSR